eukprot:m.307305 g.307305  ORF g.307305 m.307305 type:complete len:578 (+) comp42129_c0_seq1:3559-5292(+)
MVSLTASYNMEMAMERGGGGGTLEDGVALQLALELSRLNVSNHEGQPGGNAGSGGGGNAVVAMNGSMSDAALFDDPRALPRVKSNNTTECVAVPSSEHVAEIVGRQGCKIKALRAKTNTYIKTPVRGEDPVFVVTGRREDVAMAKREILAAAEHFSQIRATRKASTSQSPPLTSPSFGSNPSGFGGENQVTIKVRVPYRVVGLVVGPKGATIKRIQQLTNTYIITPSRDKEPCFEVTGTPENAEIAKREIESYIALRTGGSVDGSSDDADYPMSPVSDFNGPLTPDPIYTSAAHHFSTIREAQMNNRPNHFSRGDPSGGGNGGGVANGVFFRSKSPPMPSSSSTGPSQNFGAFPPPLNRYKASSSSSGLHGLDDGGGFAVNGFDSAFDPLQSRPASIWSYGSNRSGFGSENSAFGPPRRTPHHALDDSVQPPSMISRGGGNGAGRLTFNRAVSEPFGQGLMGLMQPAQSMLGPGSGMGFLPDMHGGVAKSGSQASGSAGTSSGGSSRQSPTSAENGRVSSVSQKECSGCNGRQIVAALVPCGHNLWCMECAESIRDDQQVCPVCQKDVASVLRIINN